MSLSLERLAVLSIEEHIKPTRRGLAAIFVGKVLNGKRKGEARTVVKYAF